MVVRLRWVWLLVTLMVAGTLANGGLAHPVQANEGPTVELRDNPALGQILTANGGLTLYRFLKDDLNKSNCTGGCATVWPPLLVDEGEAPTGGAGVSGELGTIKRDDGTLQVTYNGNPLYFFAGNAAAPADTQPGDTNGQGIGDVWFIVKAETRFVGDDPVTVAYRKAGDLGPILTANDGFSLYQFLKDQGSESVCYDGCAAVWPPLLVGTGVQPSAGPGVTGELGTTVRRDGSRQVTYEGIPLYFFAGNASAPADKQPGDTNGQGIGGVWFVYQARVPSTIFTTVLTGAAEVDNNGNTGVGDPDGQGIANVLVAPQTGRVCIDALVANTAPLILAHIHQGPAGRNGPVVVDFTDKIRNGVVKGCVNADEQLLRRIILEPQNFYVNIHSEEFPAGAVRGQLR